MKSYIKYLFLFGVLATLVSCSDEKEVMIVQPVEQITELYMTGAAVGWSSTSLTKNEDETNVFTYEVSLQWSEENKLFKFTREEGDWDKVRYLVPTSIDYNDYAKIIEDGVEYDMCMCSEMEGNLQDFFWGINEGADGIYLLTVNPSTLKMKAERIGNI